MWPAQAGRSSSISVCSFAAAEAAIDYVLHVVKKSFELLRRFHPDTENLDLFVFPIRVNDHAAGREMFLQRFELRLCHVPDSGNSRPCFES